LSRDPIAITQPAELGGEWLSTLNVEARASKSARAAIGHCGGYSGALAVSLPLRRSTQVFHFAGQVNLTLLDEMVWRLWSQPSRRVRDYLLPNRARTSDPAEKYGEVGPLTSMGATRIAAAISGGSLFWERGYGEQSPQNASSSWVFPRIRRRPNLIPARWQRKQQNSMGVVNEETTNAAIFSRGRPKRLAAVLAHVSVYALAHIPHGE